VVRIMVVIFFGASSFSLCVHSPLLSFAWSVGKIPLNYILAWSAVLALAYILLCIGGLEIVSLLVLSSSLGDIRKVQAMCFLMIFRSWIGIANTWPQSNSSVDSGSEPFMYIVESSVMSMVYVGREWDMWQTGDEGYCLNLFKQVPAVWELWFVSGHRGSNLSYWNDSKECSWNVFCLVWRRKAVNLKFGFRRLQVDMNRLIDRSVYSYENECLHSCNWISEFGGKYGRMKCKKDSEDGDYQMIYFDGLNVYFKIMIVCGRYGGIIEWNRLKDQFKHRLSLEFSAAYWIKLVMVLWATVEEPGLEIKWVMVAGPTNWIKLVMVMWATVEEPGLKTKWATVAGPAYWIKLVMVMWVTGEEPGLEIKWATVAGPGISYFLFYWASTKEIGYSFWTWIRLLGWFGSVVSICCFDWLFFLGRLWSRKVLDCLVVWIISLSSRFFFLYWDYLPWLFCLGL